MDEDDEGSFEEEAEEEGATVPIVENVQREGSGEGRAKRGREQGETQEQRTLTQSNAKMRKSERSWARMQAKQAACPAASSSVPGSLPSFVGPAAAVGPQPPVCNRVCRDWGQPPISCSCKAWPAWLARAECAGVAVANNVLITASDERIQIGDQKPEIAYWRPGGKGLRETYWYNAVLAKAYKIRAFDGHEHVVAAVN